MAVASDDAAAHEVEQGQRFAAVHRLSRSHCETHESTCSWWCSTATIDATCSAFGDAAAGVSLMYAAAAGAAVTAAVVEEATAVADED